MTINNMPFRSDRLRLSREKKNITQRELAQLCGFTEFQVSRYETGKHEPAISTLEAMAQQLNVSTDYLLGLSHDPQGIFSETSLSEDEQQLIDEYRKSGWKGVIRLGAEHLGE